MDGFLNLDKMASETYVLFLFSYNLFWDIQDFTSEMQSSVVVICWRSDLMSVIVSSGKLVYKKSGDQWKL